MPISRAQSTSTAQIDPARAKLVDAARTAWIGRLIDLSRRNNLLFYRPVPTSSIDLTSQTPGLLDLLDGKPVTGETLLPDPTRGPGGSSRLPEKPRRTARRRVFRPSILPSDSRAGSQMMAVAILKPQCSYIPLQMKRKGKELAAIEVQVAGEPQINPVLLHVLAEQTGIQIAESELIAAAMPKEPDAGSTEATAESGSSRQLIKWRCISLAAKVKGMPEFRTELSAAISNFSFAKLALVNDLKSAADHLGFNEAVAAIAGDTESRGRLGTAQSLR